ncbi:hypothetical protein IPF89_02720 [Candidatus Saccharibacteria bacterium]|jgi:hypothetical protein|nr:hypothetical protein [Candidatus Saccharimonas aalborgensis]QQR51702.1 MAG: hypothetical protein IPF89_02720 [Candidatus Saccharibacteria bacterium]QQS68433.1 MAG: hypothetical protein IPP24_00090 [Candidatus Saccharibacteria bacterium]QQS70724.1 MAG: hypothetical protein IPP92_00230 [Candidatus Saccharibacteria bacterium]
MRYYKPLQMSCFSPPVMLATFMIEIGLALYVGWRYTLDAVSKLSIAILFFLAVFQLAEYNICEGSFGVDSLSWARIGYVAITLLPPLGFHLASRIAGRRNRTMLMAAYGSAALFAGFFALTGHGISSSACLGNYVIFQSAPMAIGWYAFYYYGWLLAGTFYCLSHAKKASAPHISRALRGLAAGYLVFIVPTTAVNIVDPATIKGIPSIMCGFAVLLAVALVGVVLPEYYRQRQLATRTSSQKTSQTQGA